MKIIITAFTIYVIYCLVIIYILSGANPYQLNYYIATGQSDHFLVRNNALPYSRKVSMWLLENKDDEYFHSYIERENINLILGMHTIKNADKEMIKKLANLYIGKGMDINKNAYTGCSAIKTALYFKDNFIIKYLVMNHADMTLAGPRDSKIPFCRKTAAEIMATSNLPSSN